jgi:hypothetical protein
VQHAKDGQRTMRHAKAADAAAARRRRQHTTRRDEGDGAGRNASARPARRARAACGAGRGQPGQRGPVRAVRAAPGSAARCGRHGQRGQPGQRRAARSAPGSAGSAGQRRAARSAPGSAARCGRHGRRAGAERGPQRPRLAERSTRAAILEFRHPRTPGSRQTYCRRLAGGSTRDCSRQANAWRLQRVCFGVEPPATQPMLAVGDEPSPAVRRVDSPGRDASVIKSDQSDQASR